MLFIRVYFLYKGMNIYLYLLIVAFTVPVLAIGQKSVTEEDVTQVFEIDIAPLTVLSFRPRYRVGLEYYFGNWNCSLKGEYGSYALHNYRLGSSKWGEQYLYYAIRPHLMFQYNSTNSLKRYVGIELFYINNSDQLNNDLYDDKSSSNIYVYDVADYRRTMMGFHFLWKVKHNISNYFGLESYFGLGAAYRTNTYSNVEGRRLSDSHFYNENLFAKNYRIEGAGWLTSCTIGINLSFTLWKH